MAKQDEVPTTVTVTQAPVWNPDQLLVWFNQLATFIQGAQAVKNMPILYEGANIGQVYSLRVGPMVFVQGTVTNPTGTILSVPGMPVSPQSDTFLACSQADAPLTIKVTAGSKLINIPAPGTTVYYSGWYLGANAFK